MKTIYLSISVLFIYASANALPNVADGHGKANCVCTPYYQCANGTLIRNGAGILDSRTLPHGNNPRRRLRRDTLGKSEELCESYLDVCCSVEEVTKVKDSTPKISKTTSLKIKNNINCGKINSLGLEQPNFTLTANQSKVGEFPWMAAILRVEKTDTDEIKVYKCGSTLIHPQVILTAASCISDEKRKYKARGGEWNTLTKDEKYPHQDRDIASITVHPKFNPSTMENDIALAYLDKPFELTENIGTICLPNPESTLDNVKCLVSGWGKDLPGKIGRFQSIPKKISMPIVPRETCQSKLHETKLGRYFELPAGFICAGGDEGVDSCFGDGGGPLVCPISDEPEKYQQLGIVLWGIGCGEKNVPGVYLDVAKYRYWIDEQLISKNLAN